jgi:hypothetical protein
MTSGWLGEDDGNQPWPVTYQGWLGVSANHSQRQASRPRAKQSRIEMHTSVYLVPKNLRQMFQTRRNGPFITLSSKLKITVLTRLSQVWSKQAIVSITLRSIQDVVLIGQHHLLIPRAIKIALKQQSGWNYHLQLQEKKYKFMPR